MYVSTMSPEQIAPGKNAKPSIRVNKKKVINSMMISLKLNDLTFINSFFIL